MKLEASGVGRQVDGRWLFQGLSFVVEEGRALWITGPSGCGKSQLLRCIAELVPFEGRILLDGQTAKELGVSLWRTAVSYVGQRPPVWPGTGTELVERVRSIHAQARRGGEDPVALARGWGLAPALWERPLSSLSGGELQRLWLAIVCSRRPAVLLLDEPTSALDPEARGAVESTLKGWTSVWVTHDLSQGERMTTDRLRLDSRGLSSKASLAEGR